MGNTIQLGISIGIAFYPQDALKQEDLFKVADAALYKAKMGGRGIFVFYHPDENIWINFYGDL